MMMKKPKKAYPEIDKLILKYPLESRYKILKGDLLMQQKENDKAFLLYQEVLKNDPESPFIYISLSEYYAQEGENARAMEYIILALKNNQLGVETKIEILSEHIGNLLKRDARIEETESLFKLLIDTYPLEEEVYRYYAAFLQYIKRDKDVISVFESMLNLNPKNEQTWLSLMQIYFSGQKHEEAINISRRAIQNVEDKAQFCFYQGISLQLLEKSDSAIQVLKKGLSYLKENEKNQLRSDIYANIGDIYVKTNKVDSAYFAYEEAIKANPDNILALNNYAYYLSLDKSDLQKAERMSAKTIEKEPKNSTYLDTYAWIFYQQGNYSLSKFYIERAIDNLKKDQDPSIIYEHYGDILWMSKKDDKKALEMWQKSYDAGNKTEELKNKINNQGWKRE
jgi:tetratricopeptide (TPR) repeat protein